MAMSSPAHDAEGRATKKQGNDQQENGMAQTARSPICTACSRTVRISGSLARKGLPIASPSAPLNIMATRNANRGFMAQVSHTGSYSANATVSILWEASSTLRQGFSLLTSGPATAGGQTRCVAVMACIKRISGYDLPYRPFHEPTPYDYYDPDAPRTEGSIKEAIR